MTKLRPYQLDIAQRGVEILREYKILYLSMEVRTGKTLTSMYIAHNYGANNLLFITKKKVKEDILKQWQDLVPLFTVQGFHDITIINYESLHKYQGNPDIIICDEAHSLGQFPVPAQRTKLLKKLAHGLPIIYLSGSPSPESYSQLYHQFWVSSYSPWNEYKTFYKWAAAGYVDVKKKYIYNRAINDYSRADERRILDEIRPVMISFTQEQAGFSEFVEEEILMVKMSDRTYKLADKLRKEKVLKGHGGVILGDTAVKLMQKLHQIYSGTCLTEDGDCIFLDRSKIDAINHMFWHLKLALFYKYKGEGTMLQAAMPEKFTTDITEFNTTNKWFISQIQSGREGLNLSKADALVFYNLDFSHVSYIQARARLQTKDRTTPAKVYWVFAEGGIEEKIYKAVQNKSDYQTSHFKKDYKI